MQLGLQSKSAMKRLYLLRHAKSSWDDPALDDFDRPLAPRGKRDCEAMAHALAEAGVAPDLILCSPSRRTRDTLSRVFPSLPAGTAVEFERPLYLAEGERLLHRLGRIDDKRETVLLIGHNPGLQELGLRLAALGNRSLLVRLKAKFPTAALAEIEYAGRHWADISAGQTRLVGLTTPKDAAAG